MKFTVPGFCVCWTFIHAPRPNLIKKESHHPKLSNSKTHFWLRRSWGSSHSRTGNYIKEKSIYPCPSLTLFHSHLLLASTAARPLGEKSPKIKCLHWKCAAYVCAGISLKTTELPRLGKTNKQKNNENACDFSCRDWPILQKKCMQPTPSLQWE